MPIGSSSWGFELDKVLKHYYGLTYGEHDEKYSQFFEVMSSTRAYEESLNYSAFGAVPVKPKGGAISYDTAKENWKGRWEMVTYGKGFVVERELWDDGLTGVIKSLPKALARSVRHTVETLATNILNNATTAADTGPDGVCLVSNAHILGTSGTFSNRPTNYSDLDSTSIEQAYVDIGNWVDDRSLKIAAKPKRIVIPTETAWTAAKLFGSDKVPEDANNAINPAKGILPYTTSEFLTDTDAWYLITDVPNGLTFYWRRRPEFTQDKDFDTENAKWKVTFRCVPGWHDPRGIYGNSGA